MGLSLASAVALGWLASGSLGADWLKRWAVRSVVRRLQPHLPFKIRSVEVDGDWRALLKGQISWIRAEVSVGRPPLLARIEGPIVIERLGEKTQTFSVAFKPKITLSSGTPAVAATPLQGEVRLTAAPWLTHVDDLTLELRADTFKAPFAFVEAQGLEISLAWQESDGQTKLQTKAKMLSYAPTGASPVGVAIEDFEASSRFGAGLEPLRIDPEVQVLAHWEKTFLSLPTRDGDVYVEAPSHDLEVRTQIRFANSSSAPPALKSFRVEAAGRGKPAFFGSELESPLERPLLRWGIEGLRLGDVLPPLTRTLRASGGVFARWGDLLERLRLPTGKLTSSGEMPLASPRLAQFKVAIEKLSAAWDLPGFPAWLPRMDLALGFNDGALQGELRMPEIWVRKARLALEGGRLPFHAKPVGKSFELAVGATSGTRWKIGPELVVQTSPLTGRIATDYELGVKLQSNKASTEGLTQALCLPSQFQAPALLEVVPTEVHAVPDALESTGGVTVSVFGGEIRLSQLALYDWSLGTPDIELDLDVEELDLEAFGKWAGFGKMEGLFKAHAHDAVVRGLFPIQYDFSFDALPLPKTGALRFSGPAMRNVVRVLGGAQAVEQMPGVLNFFAFGFGQYDVQYFGLSAYAKNGLMMIETHDPGVGLRGQHFDSEVDEALAKKGDAQHFILSGGLIKIPLAHKNYPVIADMTAMAGPIKYILGELTAIQAAKLLKERPATDETLSCVPPGFPLAASPRRR